MEVQHSRHGQVCTEVKEGGSLGVPGESQLCGSFLSVVALKVVFPPGKQIFLLGFQIWESLQWMGVCQCAAALENCLWKTAGPASYNGHGCHSPTISEIAICGGWRGWSYAWFWSFEMHFVLLLVLKYIMHLNFWVHGKQLSKTHKMSWVVLCGCSFIQVRMARVSSADGMVPPLIA